MTPPATVEDLFLAALDRPPADRPAFLADACGGDAERLRRVRELLVAHDQSRGPLDAPPAPGLTADLPAVADPLGAVIGPYRLVEVIGEGGMGTVYLAQQTEPVKRLVALKVIKAGMDSRQILARFEAERQALALMDHPNIAKVLDAGATPEGRPYFVMELVKGVPITRYCDDHLLTPRERLELFVPVCQAVQHAHQKGIIHRDLKPSNVLVAPYDGRPVPKVIDFGVAKAAGQALTEKTLVTGLGAVVGTLEYMSPEQAELNNLDVDTRSDVYSLGVLLYELLTGTTPLSGGRLKRAALLEALRMVREEEPPMPSRRLSDSGEALASISARRHTEPTRLTKMVRGELDWIAMKALEKDRNRRYETANGLGMDVQRYLADEAVQACPPTARYKLRKFLRRNKRPVLAAAVIFILLVGGTVGTAVGLMRALAAEGAARGESDRARDAETDAKAQRDVAVTEKERAGEEAAIARAVNDFLLNDLLAEAAPDRNARAKKVTVEEVLGRAAARIGGKFEKQPRIEAAIRQTIGDTYCELGDYSAAKPHLERAVELRRRILGEEHPDTLNSLSNLALLYKDQGQFPKAEPIYLAVLEVRRRAQGEEHPDTLSSMNNLAVLYVAQSQFTKAEPLHVKALEVQRRVLGKDDRATLITLNNLALLYLHKGELARAEPLLVETLESRRRVLGSEHLDTLRSMNNLAGLYQSRGEFTKAEPLFLEALEVQRRVLTEEHSQTLTVMNNLAQLYQARHQFPKAEPLFDRALEIQRRILGEEHPDTLRSMNNLALLYQDQRQLAKAEPLFVKTLEARRRVLGEEHLDTIGSMNNLATVYWFTRKLDRSVPLFEEALKKYQARFGPDHPHTLLAMANLGVNYRDAGRVPEGIASLERAWELTQKRPGPLVENLAWVPSVLAATYDQAGQFPKAEPLYREVLARARGRHDASSPPVAAALVTLGLNLLQQKKYAEADPLLRECLAIREQKQPDDWTTSNTRSMLGGALLGQKQYAEAEPLLVEGYEGMKKRETAIPAQGKARLTEALDRLVQLYDAWGKADEATRWRAELEVRKASAKEETKPPPKK